jgi:hypothetical protein
MRSALTGAAPDGLRIEEGQFPGVDREPPEAPELPQTLHYSLSRHPGPLGELLLVDGGIDLNMVAEWAPVAFGKLCQAPAEAAKRVNRAELDLSQRGVPEPGDDQLQKLTGHAGVLIEERVEVGRARGVDLNRLEGDYGRRTRPAVNGTHLTQQTSRVEDSQDDLATVTPRTDFDAAGAEQEGFAPGVTVAEDDRPSRERLPPAAGLEALGFGVRQPAEEVTFGRVGRRHGNQRLV